MWGGFGPVMARVHGPDLLRAVAGALSGVLATGAVLRAAGCDPWLIAPFGATAVLVFAAPNSPLAQPWSVVVGNTLSALVALLVVTVTTPGPWVPALAVALAIGAMMALRALHPPGGAVALFVALGPAGVQTAAFAALPVAAGSVLLVLGAVIWHRLTGRRYPLRQPHQPGPHGTTDPAPDQRGLDPAALEAILDTYHQSANLGVADLARLIGAADQAVAARRIEGFACGDIMSRDLVTVPPDAPLSQVADLFRERGFTSLPVVAADGRFLGMIFQIDLIRRARADALRLNRRFLAAFARLIDAGRRSGPTAADIMQTAVPRTTPLTPAGAALPLLTDGGAEAVPVVVGPQIVGIVTRSDLLSALARHLARDQAPPG